MFSKWIFAGSCFLVLAACAEETAPPEALRGALEVQKDVNFEQASFVFSTPSGWTVNEAYGLAELESANPSKLNLEPGFEAANVYLIDIEHDHSSLSCDLRIIDVQTLIEDIAFVEDHEFKGLDNLLSTTFFAQVDAERRIYEISELIVTDLHKRFLDSAFTVDAVEIEHSDDREHYISTVFDYHVKSNDLDLNLAIQLKMHRTRLGHRFIEVTCGDFSNSSSQDTLDNLVSYIAHQVNAKAQF